MKSSVRKFGDWKRIFVFRGRFNNYGGMQYITEYKNEKKNLILEVCSYKEPNGLKYAEVNIRNNDWEEGEWISKEFETSQQARKYANDYMKKH